MNNFLLFVKIEIFHVFKYLYNLYITNKIFFIIWNLEIFVLHNLPIIILSLLISIYLKMIKIYIFRNEFNY